MSNAERYEVLKAGGWSLANAGRARSVWTYVRGNQDIHYFIPSALGAEKDGDFKTTDLLIACSPKGGNDPEFNRVWQKVHSKYSSPNEIFEEIYRRHISIGKDLGYYGFLPLLEQVESWVASASKVDSESDKENYRHLIPSRGEWLNGHMWAELLDFRFIDPTELIRFRKDGRFDERSYRTIGSRLRGGDRFVVPGFYGLSADGEVRTFQRDGSDVTGSVIAHGVYASIYRNLTSTNGVLSADPTAWDEEKRCVVRTIDDMTFWEYRELGIGGFKVLHRDAIIPVATMGIPINVRYSEKSESRGTIISLNRPDVPGEDVIGIAGKGGFVNLRIHKLGMDEDKGIAERILRIIRKNGISFGHLPTENDSVSIVFSEQQLDEGQEERIMAEISRRIIPTELDIRRNIGILSVVGQGLKRNGSVVVAQLAEVLNGEAIGHGIIYIEPSITITAFLDGSRLEEAIRVSHEALIEKRNS